MGDWFSGIRPQELVRKLRARRTNTSVQDIEDAVQDVLLKIHRKLQSDSPPPKPNNPDAYLATSVEHQLHSIYRKNKRDVLGITDEEFEQQLNAQNPSLLNDPAEVLEARERADIFRLLVSLVEREATRDDASPPRDGAAFAALQSELRATLTNKQWALLRMRVLHQTKFEDCARALGVSVGAAYNWINKIQDTVRACLLTHGIEPGALDESHRPIDVTDDTHE